MRALLCLVITVHACSCPSMWACWLQFILLLTNGTIVSLHLEAWEFPESLLLFCEASLFDGGGERERRSFPVGKKIFSKSYLQCVDHYVNEIHISRSCWITPDVLPWSFLSGPLQNSQVQDWRVESIVEDYSLSRFIKMVIVNTELHN